MFKDNNKGIRTYFTPCSSVSIVNFEKVNADWVYQIFESIINYLVMTAGVPDQL